jgi:hypothetical protein
VRTHFILVFLLSAGSVPSVIHARFKHHCQMMIPMLVCSLPGGFNEQQATFLPFDGTFFRATCLKFSSIWRLNPSETSVSTVGGAESIGLVLSLASVVVFGSLGSCEFGFGYSWFNKRVTLI